MSKTVAINQDKLLMLKETVASDSNIASHNDYCSELTEAAPEVDEYEIGDEGSNPPVGGNFYHVNESYNVSVRGDLDSINTIEFIPHEDAREEGYEDDEIEDFEPYYEVEAMDMDGNTILYADLTVEELFDYFPQSIVNDIIERDKSNATRLSNPSINQYRIEDILYRDTTPSDVDNVDEVNRIAKKIQTGGPSAYLLTDGDIIYFHDHIYVNNIDGITPDKFIALGNIRLSNGGFELIKEPTRQQMYELKQWIRQQNRGVYVDFCEESHQTYPRTLFSTKYGSPNAERIVNDIYYYFEEGIKPQDNFYESKENNSEVIIENTFEKWFGSSILKDESGQPLKMYHGTDAEFDSFSKEHIGRTGAYEGYGFNFTPFESRARGYNSKRVIEAYLRVTNPMTTKSYNISLRQLVEVIRQLDEGKPYTDTIVAAYEPPRYGENWDKKYYMRALPSASRTIYQYNKENEYGDAGLYAEICLNGNADKFKTIDVFEKLGYDSAIFYDNDGRINTVVVFEPNQIKRTSNKTFDMNSDIMDENFKSKNIIKESQESKSISAAKKLVMQRLNYNEQEADDFIRVKLRNDIPSLRTPQGGKFILGVTRMFCDGELRTANDIGNLNSTLKLVASDAHINEYDRNLNGMSAQELVQRFAKAMSDNLEAEKAEIGQMAFDTPSDYEIVRIDSFEQAEEYGDYVSWCVTHDESMFDSYTSNGINQFYFCLKNGFENVEEAPSEGCPLDEYGLSMIAVSVNENGMLNTCTCRWNHSNGGDDSIMNAKEVSQVIGANFFEVFKPNNKWKELIANVIQCLTNGEDPRNVFDSVGNFSEGFAGVQLNNKWNFINQEGRLISNQWFDDVGVFSEGFAWVVLNDKWNYINQEGRLLSNQWFDYAGDFSEGFAMVILNNKWNFINQEGRLLSDQWFDNVGDFSEGFAKVQLNGKWNYINQDGRLLSDQWFDDVGDFSEGFARVKLNNKWNFINQEGRLLSDQWFDNVYDFSEGFAGVQLNGKCNFINQEGKFLSNQWFDDAYYFRNGFVRVQLNGNTYKLDTSGNLSLIESKNKNKKIVVSENQLKTIKENIDFEVDSSEIDLSSFKKKHELVPNIWNPDGTLNSRVRLKLLDIADDFWEYVNLTWVKPSGIILTGSICNFNWSQYSDIDLHLIVDFDEIDEKTEFVKDYLDSKKNEWNNEHSGLQIMGYPVELYVQNLGEMPESNGIYDLEENDWVREPNPDDIKSIGLNKFSIKDKAAKIMTIIDDMYDALASTDDSHKIEQIGDDAQYIWKKVKEMRKSSLEKNGESGSGNIVYKYMRRKGYLDKLWNLRTICYDKSNSITEGIRYDNFRNNQMVRYKVVADMAEDGYIFHGTGEDGNGVEWDTVDRTKIKGGSRATYGYGIYFTDHAYKCEKYTTYEDGHYIIANINGFEIINLRDKIDKNRNIFLKKQREYYLLQNELDRARNNREYDEISSWIEEYNSTVDKKLLNAIIEVIEKSDENDLTYFYLNDNIPLLWYSDGDPKKQLSELYLSLGIDGFEYDTEYVIFNFDKLNKSIVKDKEALIDKYIQKSLSWFKEKKIYVDESVKKYITLLKENLISEETVADGSSNGNPYKDRWKAERQALKNYVCNYGTVMQSKEDDKGGKLYKVFYDKGISELIGYNYALCVQWDEIQMKPKSIVYIRALDKFTPNIRRNIQYDTRGFDNVQGTYDDMRF